MRQRAKSKYDPRLDSLPLPLERRVTSHKYETQRILSSNYETGKVGVWYDPGLSSKD